MSAQQAASFNAASFIVAVAGRGITLTVAKGDICADRASLLTKADVETTRRHKAAIVAELEARAAAITPTVIA
jgi:cell division ATPase FtsA